MSDKYTEIGAILAAARRDRNKTLKDAEESTKIMASYLEAIEAGEPDKLPAQEYFMLFSRSYAQYLGVDPVIFDEIEEIAAAEKSVAPARKREPKADEEPPSDDISPQAQEKIFGKTLMFVVIAIVVVFIAFFVYTRFFGPSDATMSPDDAAETEGVGHAADEIPDPGLKTFTYPDQPYQPPEKLRLQMIAKQDVWALVVRDGDTVLNRKLVAGQQRQWEADYRYNLTVGISTAVDLYLNGRRLAPLSDQARIISGLEINQVNYEEFLLSEADQTSGSPASMPETAPAQPQVEEESWIEPRPETTMTNTVEQQPEVNTAAAPQQDDSRIELPPDTTKPDTTGMEAPDGI